MIPKHSFLGLMKDDRLFRKSRDLTITPFLHLLIKGEFLVAYFVFSIPSRSSKFIFGRSIATKTTTLGQWYGFYSLYSELSGSH